MHAQRHPHLRHCPEGGGDILIIGHSRLGVGRGSRRVELGCDDVPRGESFTNLLRSRRIGQVERHQRLKAARRETAGVERREYSDLIIGGLCSGGDGGDEVWHDDGACELARRGAHRRAEHVIAVAQVVVPVVGAAQRELRRHRGK
eukprot:scaffold37214_cov32-Tisochrysis_lutea.AAC.1